MYNKRREDMILLYSGGLDSYIGWHFLDRPRTVYIDIEHRYRFNELKAIGVTIPETKVIYRRLYLGDVERPDAYIPMRNAFLLLATALEADMEKGEQIAMVVQKGELDLEDRTPWFFHTMSTILSTLNKCNMRVISPFFDMTKTDMVKWYVTQRLPIKDLKRTWSCYNPSPDIATGGYIPCGACGACFRRWVAFELNGIQETYTMNPWETRLAEEYIQKMKAGKYDEQRTDETFRALKSVGVTI
jgi:7-cyano-7-deazaguanine synthase